MISLKQLNYALAVANTLHFKKAAEQCHISQSTLSTALNELEKQLGIQLFERDNKKVLVTPSGKEVLTRARLIMHEVEDLLHLAESQQNPLSYPLTLGVIPTIAPFLLPKMLPLLKKQFPYAKLKIVEAQSGVLVDQVKTGEIDTAILALPFPLAGLLALEFWEEDFYWITANKVGCNMKEEISSDELDHSGLMLLTEGHCLKDHIMDVCRLSEQTDHHGLSATSLNTLVQLVISQMGTTLIPEMALEQLVQPNPSLTALHLNESSPHRTLAFLIRPNYTRMACIDILISLCKTGLSGDK